MTTELTGELTTEPTGERFIPELMGEQLVEAEHVARYALAAQLARGRRVLDACCGVGWGTGLLTDAGASSATGLDLDADAVANAQRRVPGAHFVQGDVVHLPWDAESYDLVVCFEGLEHVHDQDKALDELVRVLAPEGLLLVSSPNPRVYPAGNPFHLHEFTPEELLEAVGQRLPNVSHWSQHNQIASVLVQHGSFPPGETLLALARTVAPLKSGSDPYSMVIAGRGPLPLLQPLLCCAPSEQLLRLEAIDTQLSEERKRMSNDQKQVVEERELILAERSEMLRSISGLNATISVYSERIASLERQTEALRREREHTGLLLLESEQQMPKVLSMAEAKLREQEQVNAGLAAQVAQLQHDADVLWRNAEVFRTSKSWRLTAPLRALAQLRRSKL